MPFTLLVHITSNWIHLIEAMLKLCHNTGFWQRSTFRKHSGSGMRCYILLDQHFTTASLGSFEASCILSVQLQVRLHVTVMDNNITQVHASRICCRLLNACMNGCEVTTGWRMVVSWCSLIKFCFGLQEHSKLLCQARTRLCCKGVGVA